MLRGLILGRAPSAPARAGARCCAASLAVRWPSGGVGLVADRTEAKKKKKKKCDKKTKGKSARRGRTCDDGKCICDRCKGCLASCDGNVDCASFPRSEGGIACTDDVFGDCSECTTNAQCDAKYPDQAGGLECVLYHGPI